MVFSTSFLAFIQGLKIFSFGYRRDDDSCDRLNHHYSTLFLLVTSILISSKQYVGTPIFCWVPKEFSGAWQNYVNSYCWIKNTYTVPLKEVWELPKPDERPKLEINYYQWVPIVLLIQALMFYFPSIIWRLLNWTLGVNAEQMVKKAMDVCSKIESGPVTEPKKDDSKEEDQPKNDEPKSLKEKLEKKEHQLMACSEIRDIAHHLDVSIEAVHESKSNIVKSFLTLMMCGFGSRKYGSYLLVLYLFTKVLYIINVVGQLFILNVFLGTAYKYFGFQLLHDLVKGNDWEATGHFPRITMCDFEVRKLGQRQNYTVQCVLPINLFNEKIYIFIWFWILLVAIVTTYSFFLWILRMLPFQKTRFVKGLLVTRTDNWTESDDILLNNFLVKRLKNDGALLIYLIYLNAGDLVTKDLLELLWVRYKLKLVTKDGDNGDLNLMNEQFL